MRTWIRFAAAPLAVAVLAGAASAATVTYPDGKTSKLVFGQEVTGPATIHSEAGKEKDTIVLRKGAVVRYLSTETDAKGNKAESFFLKSGACDANTGYFTHLATPSFWAFPEKQGTRASFYAETFGADTAYARTAGGSAAVRLLVTPAAHGDTQFQIGENQGVTLRMAGAGDLRFTTDPHNEWRNGAVRLVYPVASGVTIDTYIPKATSGAVRPSPDLAGKTSVENAVTSWKSGSIRIITLRGTAVLGDGQIGPGVTATIDNATGTIEIGFKRIEFATLKAAVSLTSEFASLATSPLSKAGK
jgi:hypothetical protein